MRNKRLTDERLAYLERVAAAYVRLRAGEVADRPCYGTLKRFWCARDMQAALRRLREQADEIERLRAIVDRLPRTADGVPVVPGARLWERCYSRIAETPPVECRVSVIDPDAWGSCSGRKMARVETCYSTREAAEAAMREVQP